MTFSTEFLNNVWTRHFFDPNMGMYREAMAFRTGFPGDYIVNVLLVPKYGNVVTNWAVTQFTGTPRDCPSLTANNP